MEVVVPAKETKKQVVQKYFICEELPEETPNSEKINFSLTLTLKFVALLLAIMAISFITELSDIVNNSFKMNKQEKPAEFMFYPASDFAYIKYYGKKELFNEIVSMIMKTIESTETTNEKDVSSAIGASIRNFLLFGPPGTGKRFLLKD